MTTTANSVSSKSSKDSTATIERISQINSVQVPNITAQSLEHFKKIIKNDMKLLEFEDQLSIFSLNGQEIGQFTISVTSTLYKKENCFKVSAKSSALIDEVPCGTEINAIVNERLETLEQDQHEYIRFTKNPIERKTLMTLDEDEQYKINQVENSASGSKQVTFKIKKSLMHGYVSESSNLILQRLMIQNNLVETFALFTFDSEANPCFVFYKPLDTRTITLDDHEVEIVGIERTIEAISDLPTTWQIYFTKDGHMVNRVQIGYPAIMRSIHLPKPIETDEYLPKITIEKKPLDWENDVQMKSRYLDRKEELKNDYDQYMADHPDAKALMADYLQSVLSFKPANVVSFSKKFFASYSKRTSSNKLLPSTHQEVNILKQKK